MKPPFATPRRLTRIALSLAAALCAPSTALADQPTDPDDSAAIPVSPPSPSTLSETLFADWRTTRQQWAEKGISFDLTFVADGTKNVRGGIDTAGSTWRHVLDLALTLDTKPLFNLEGGSVYVDFQNAQGPNPSDRLIGDVQGIDGLDGVPGMPHQNRTQLSQIWYQQSLWNNAVRIKVGKVDANAEFDHSDIAQEFLHQSTGSSATLFTLPTYPDQAFGISLFAKPNENLQIGFGLYDGSYASGLRTGNLGPKTFFRSAQDLFLIAEIDQSWNIGKDQLPGRLGVGGWYSTNSFKRLDGGSANGTGAPYLLLEQFLWRADPNSHHDARAINCFFMYGYADPAISIFDHNIGGGISWAGPIPTRPDDVIGTGIQAVHFSDGYQPTHAYEISYETFYRLQLTPWLMIKPDLQYISHPGGRGLRDALAFTIRLQVAF